MAVTYIHRTDNPTVEVTTSRGLTLKYIPGEEEGVDIALSFGGGDERVYLTFASLDEARDLVELLRREIPERRPF